MSAGTATLTAKFQRALALHQQGQLASARAMYEEILQRQPRHFDALHLSGVIAAQMNNPSQALQLIGRAIKLNPRHAAALLNHGSALKALGQSAAALRSYDSAIEIMPDYAEAHCCRGKVFRELRQWDAALASHERAIALRPDYAEAFTERGIAQRELGRLPEALASHDRALAIDGKLAHAHLNRANVLVELGQLDAALESFSGAIALKPDFAEAHANRSTVLLLRGDLANGWADYEWRWKLGRSTMVNHNRNFTQPRWTGSEPVAGRTVLLHAEQGLGDTLQFCRYATLVANEGATVLLQVPKALVELLATLEGVAAIFADTDPLPAFDCYSPLMSLPAALRTTLSTVPARVPYLRSTEAKRLFWRQKLGERGKRRVGLVWSGGFRPHQPELRGVNERRNVPLAKLAGLGHPDIEFYSLQKGQPAESELAHLKSMGWGGPDLIDFTALLHDFSDTAALIEQLDLVISVDTATAHLAGALGKPVWILNRFDTCWRWMLDRADSPWYPTARLYRQQRPGDWDGVVARLRQDLVQSPP